MLGIEPRAAEWESLTLPTCYEAPQSPTPSPPLHTGFQTSNVHLWVNVLKEISNNGMCDSGVSIQHKLGAAREQK